MEERPPSAPEGAATQRHRHMTLIASSRLAAVPMSSNENGPAPRHCSDHRVWSCPAILSARPHARRPVSELIVGRVTLHGWVGGSRVQKARPGNRRRELELMHSRVSSVLRVLSLSSGAHQQLLSPAVGPSLAWSVFQADSGPRSGRLLHSRVPQPSGIGRVPRLHRRGWPSCRLRATRTVKHERIEDNRVGLVSSSRRLVACQSRRSSLVS